MSKGTTIGYDDFVSDAGFVVAFEWSFENGSRRESLRWRIEYRRRDGTLHSDAGGGNGGAADLAMKPGDGSAYKVRWRYGSHFSRGQICGCVAQTWA